MSLFPLFNITVPVRDEHVTDKTFGPQPSSGPAATDHTAAVGAFVTPQTLVSFTGATGVIASLYACIGTTIPIPHEFNRYLLLFLSILVGAVIYWINEADPKASPMSVKQRTISIVIAGLNTAILFNASRAILGA